MRQTRHHSRHGSWGQRLMQALADRSTSMVESKASIAPHERVWYDQFTSTDWVHDAIADSHRVKALRSRKDFWGRVRVALDGSQGWILSALCGFVVALVAYVVDVAEATVFDFKDGYCATAWYLNEKVNKLPSGLMMHRIRSQLTCRHSNAVPEGRVTTGKVGLKPSVQIHWAKCGPISRYIWHPSSVLPVFLVGLHC